MNIPLLDHLRTAQGAFVPLADLGGESIVADLQELVRWGFLLEFHPYQGVAYRGPSARLCPDQIEWQIGTRQIGRRIAVWNRVQSTNDVAASAAGSLANDGLVVLAEEQTRGRGRRGRSWMAPPGSSLLMSVLIFPQGPTAILSWLTALGAVATADVVSELCGVSARIKWPNDVRVEGRKIAGVLVERHFAAVIGIGLNVGQQGDSFPDELRQTATSMQMITGACQDRSEIARLLIQRLDALYSQAKDEGPEPLARLWTDRLEPLGRRVRIQTHQGCHDGELVDAHLISGLTLREDSGEIRRFAHAEVLDVDGERLSPVPF